MSARRVSFLRSRFGPFGRCFLALSILGVFLGREREVDQGWRDLGPGAILIRGTSFDGVHTDTTEQVVLGRLQVLIKPKKEEEEKDSNPLFSFHFKLVCFLSFFVLSFLSSREEGNQLANSQAWNQASQTDATKCGPN